MRFRIGKRSASPFPCLAKIVDRENVIPDTDCNLGGRVHPQIAWAKLRALRDGAALASKKCGVEFKSACAG